MIRETYILVVMVVCVVISPARGDGLLCLARDYLGSMDTPGIARQVSLLDGYAYVVDESGVLSIIDVTDPKSPSLIGDYDIGLTRAFNVDVRGGYAYVVTNNMGLQVIDVSDPASPQQIGSYLSNIPMYDVHVFGGVAYIAGAENGLLVFDVSDPSAPQLQMSVPTTNFSYEVCIEDSLLYLADGQSGLRVFDVNDPLIPVELGAHPTTGIVLGLDVIDDIAYLIDYVGKLDLIDVSDPSAPVQISSTPIDGQPRSIQVVDGRAYIADGESVSLVGLRVVDVSDPALVVEVYTYDTDGLAYGVAMDGTVAYVASGTAGLKIIETFETTGPFLGLNDSHDRIRSIQLVDTKAYALEDLYDFAVFDIADPANMVLLGSVHINSRPVFHKPRNFAVVGDLVYFTTLGDGVVVYDISDPTDIHFVGEFGGDTKLIEIIDGFAYVAEDSLEVYDLTDPLMPTLLGSIPLVGEANRFVVDGTTVYIVGRTNVFEIIDASDPGSMVSHTWIGGLEDYFYSVVVENDVAYLASYFQGVQVLDVSTHADPVLLAEVDTVQEANTELVFFEQTLLVRGGVQVSVLDVSDPFIPEVDFSLSISGGSFEIDADNEVAYYAAFAEGLGSLDLSDCEACTADTNNDGQIDFFDISAFLSAYSMQDPIADFSGDGLFDFFDISAFLTAFAAGCP